MAIPSYGAIVLYSVTVASTSRAPSWIWNCIAWWSDRQSKIDYSNKYKKRKFVWTGKCRHLESISTQFFSHASATKRNLAWWVRGLDAPNSRLNWRRKQIKRRILGMKRCHVMKEKYWYYNQKLKLFWWIRFAGKRIHGHVMLFERRAWVKFPLFILIPATAEYKHCFPDDDKIRTGAVTHFNQSSSSNMSSQEAIFCSKIMNTLNEFRKGSLWIFMKICIE